MLRRLMLGWVIALVAAPGGAAAAELGSPAPGPALAGRPPEALPGARTGYRTLAEHEAGRAALVAGHPGIARHVVLTRASVEGRQIAGVELATDVARADDGRPVLVVLGTVHAREWASGEVAAAFAQDLAQGWAGDARIRALLDRVRVLVVPVVNPDGFVRSRSGSRGRAWRLWRGNRDGIDLNRNAGAGWGGRGAAAEPGAGDFRGPAPWAAPEAEAIHELLRTRPVTALVALHAVAGVVLHPPGDPAARVTGDERVLAALARSMGEATGYRTGRVPAVLYPVSGTLEDWSFAAQGALAATIELGGEGFFGPYERNVVAPYLGRMAPPLRSSRARRFHGGRRLPVRSRIERGRAREPEELPGIRRAPRGGVREALLRAAEAAADPARHGVIEGVAPTGAILTAARHFATETGEALPRALPDGASSMLQVGPGGRFTWHLGPSTRPFAPRPEAWMVTCTVGRRVVRRVAVVTGRGTRAWLAPCSAAA